MTTRLAYCVVVRVIDNVARPMMMREGELDVLNVNGDFIMKLKVLLKLDR